MRTEYSDYCGSPSNWAVINTHPHREQVAVENLQRQEFRAYCPMVRRQRRHARRVTDVLRPLFPGYLFTQVSSDMQRWRPMLSTFGVRAVVRCGDRLSLIEDAFIQSLMFRSAGIIQGVYKRGLDGNASSDKALEYKEAARIRSERAWSLVEQL